MKKIILAPDSFKGSLTAAQVCDILAQVAHQYFPNAELVKLPIADGGEGLVDALLYACGGKKVKVKVKDPLLREIDSFYGILPDSTVVIEMAAASGLPLLDPQERNPLHTTTHGTGQLIADALEKGYRKFILGLGGSATNDGGAGAANALGIRYLDEEDQNILTGGSLLSLQNIDLSQMLEGLGQSNFLIACDVTNPLFGPQGAAAIFAPQKGANPQQVTALDLGLERLAAVIVNQTGIDLQAIPGSGAAGGLAVPFLAFTNAEIKSGVDIVLDQVGFEQHLAECDLVITGEGKSDDQSTMGKALTGVGKRASKQAVPVIALSGSLGEGYEKLYEYGISAFFSTVNSPAALDELLIHAEDNLRSAADNLFRLLSIYA